MTFASLITSSVPTGGDYWFRNFAGSRSEVWYDASTVYQFQNNGYFLSTDAGQNWGSKVVFIGYGETVFDWYDERWNDPTNDPFVHVVTHDDGLVDGQTRAYYYNRLDVSDGSTLYAYPGKLIQAMAACPDGNPLSVTVALNGDVHIIGGISPLGVPAQRTVHYVSTDQGANWTSNASNFGQGLRDKAVLQPDASTGDTADVIAIWADESTGALKASAYDASGDSWGTATIDTGFTWGRETNNRYCNMSAAFDRTSGHILVGAFEVYNATPNTLHVYDVYGTGSITAGADVLTATAYAMVCSVSRTFAGNMRITYGRDPNGASFNGMMVYYKESSDFGQTWGTEQSYSTLIPTQLTRFDTDMAVTVNVWAPTYWTSDVVTAPLPQRIYIEASVPPRTVPLGMNISVVGARAVPIAMNIFEVTNTPTVVLLCRHAPVDGVRYVKGWVIDSW